MFGSSSDYNYEKLRRDLREECYAAYFGGGIGPAILDAGAVDKASPEKLIKMAKAYGFNLRKYKK